MATYNVSLGSTIGGQAAGSTYQLAPGTYYGQQWTPGAADIYLGDPSGLTRISGAWLVTSWSGSGSTYKATQGLSDANGTTQTSFPTPPSMYLSFTASFNTTSGTYNGTAYAGEMIVTGSPSPSLTLYSNVWNAAGTIANSTQIVCQISGTTGGAGTYGVSTAQTVGSGTVYGTNDNGVPYGAFANFDEDLYVNGTRYTRIAAPGPAGANTWWLNPSDKSVNVNTNLAASTCSFTATISGNVMTIVSVTSGSITAGQAVITGSGVTVGTQVIGYGGGYTTTTAGATFILNKSMTIGSATAMNAQAVVEYSAMNPCINNGGGSGVTIEDLTITQYACNSTQGAIELLANLALRGVSSVWNHGSGVSVASGTVINNCKLNYNGQYGYSASSSDNMTIKNSEIANNNYALYSPQWAAGAGKFASCTNTAVIGCKIHDNQGVGGWWDLECCGAIVSNNQVYNNNCTNLGGSGAGNYANGIMIEISRGPVSVSNNTIYNNDGAGIYLSNAGGLLMPIEVFGNIVFVGPSNSHLTTGAICSNNASRGGDANNIQYEARNLYVHNNTIIHTTDTTQDGMLVYRAIQSPGNVWDYNVYITPNSSGTYWIFDANTGNGGTPTPLTWAQVQTGGLYDQHSTNIAAAADTIAQIMSLLRDGQPAGSIVPLDIRELMISLTVFPPFPTAPIIS